MSNTAEIQDRIEKCQKILDSDPNSQIFAALAEAYRKKGDLDKAFRVCQHGLKVHPSYGSAHVVMAKINLDRRQYDWAESEARRAAELDGWTRTTELLLAEIHIYKGEFNQAIKLLNRLHQSDPDNDQIKKLLDIARQLPEQQAATVPETPGPEDAIEGPSGDDGQDMGVGRRAATPAVELSIEEILEKSIAIAGVDGAAFANREGLVVASQWVLSHDVAQYGATLSEIGNNLDREMDQTGCGGVVNILMETEGHTYYLVRCSKGMFFFVVGDASNLGSLRMRLESLLGQQG